MKKNEVNDKKPGFEFSVIHLQKKWNKHKKISQMLSVETRYTYILRIMKRTIIPHTVNTT